MTRWSKIVLGLFLATTLGSVTNAGEPASAFETAPCKSRWYISAQSKDQARDLEPLHIELSKSASKVSPIDRSHITYELREPLGLVGALLLSIDEREFTINTRITRECQKWDGGYAHRLDWLSRAEETSIRGEMNKLADRLRAIPELKGLKFQVRSK